MTRNSLIITGMIAALGAVVTGIGEFFLLYSPDGGYGLAAGYTNFLHSSVGELGRGFYLGAFSAPIYVLGYWHVVGMLRLTQSKAKWPIMGLATFGFMLGLVWLLTNAYLGIIVHSMTGADETSKALLLSTLVQIDDLSLPLLQMIRVAVFGLSAFIVWFIWKKDTHYPRWMVVFNPFTLILMVFGSFLIIPSIAQYFVPAALNVAHVIFFSLSAFFAWKYAR